MRFVSSQHRRVAIRGMARRAERIGEPEVDPLPTTIFIIVYTSGTTGSPTGVLFQQRSPYAHAPVPILYYDYFARQPVCCGLSAQLGGIDQHVLHPSLGGRPTVVIGGRQRLRQRSDGCRK